jgi:hypothetical protein
MAEKKIYSDAASGTMFRINKCFQRSKKKLSIYFSFKMTAKNFNSRLHNTDLILETKKYSSHDPSL